MKKRFWYFDIIHKYLPPTSEKYPRYLIHVVLVTEKALKIAKNLNLSPEQLQFIEEGAMLHDIGISKVENDGEYIRHGILGSEILNLEGYPKHALVAERHTGVGLCKEDIIKDNLPLPHQDYIPVSIEEKIISYADLFYTKDPNFLWTERSIDEVRKMMYKFGERHKQTLEEWINEFQNGQS